MSNSTRTVAVVGAAVALVFGVYWIGDALIETDEERLEAVVDLATETMGPDVANRALAWTDPEAQPVELSALGMTRTYDDRNADELGPDARSRLSRFYGQSFTALSSAIEVVDDRATVSMRLMGEGGMMQVEVRLVRADEDADWLVSHVRVGR